MQTWEREGSFAFVRTISGNTGPLRVTGTATWTRLDDRIYRYDERGTLGASPCTQTYRFDFGRREMQFADGRVFVPFPDPENVQVHHCGDDVYTVSATPTSLRVAVVGPWKRYTIETVYL